MKTALKCAALCGPLLVIAVLALPPVFAQGWGWGDNRPRWEERRRPYSGPAEERSRHPRCRQLEDQLAGGWARGAGAQDQIPQLDAEIEKVSRDYRRAQAEAERADCYEDMFIFGRSLRQTRRCVEMDERVEATRSRLTHLRKQRELLDRSTNVRARQDDLLAELARYDCGESYVREYRSRNRAPSFFDLWSDEDSDDDGGSGYPSEAVPYESYRTICVRLCDGFFYPVSYSTLPSRFAEDEAKCKSQCAAPSELFFHRVHDQDVNQAVSISGKPYTALPNAFRHQKVYIRGCSCNASEYSREEIAKSEEALRQKTAAAAPAPASEAAGGTAPVSGGEASGDGAGASGKPGDAVAEGTGEASNAENKPGQNDTTGSAPANGADIAKSERNGEPGRAR